MKRENHYDTRKFVPRIIRQTNWTDERGTVMSSFIQLQASARSYQLFDCVGRSRGLRVMGLIGLALCATMIFAGQAIAGAGCDLNVRVSNNTANAIMVYGVSASSASKSGLNVWGPLEGMVDTVLDKRNSGAASHSKQGVELKLPCWTGKVDFRVRYLDGSSKKWVRRDDVKLKSGETIQINIKN